MNQKVPHKKIKKSHRFIHRDPADSYTKNPYKQMEQKKRSGPTTLGRPHPAAGEGGHFWATSPGQIWATSLGQIRATTVACRAWRRPLPRGGAEVGAGRDRRRAVSAVVAGRLRRQDLGQGVAFPEWWNQIRTSNRYTNLTAMKMYRGLNWLRICMDLAPHMHKVLEGHFGGVMFSS
jgi:hypothetical protein